MSNSLTEQLQTLVAKDAADGIDRAVVGAVIDHGGSVLVLQRRPDEEFLPGLWELPSGKVEEGEDLLTALHREVAEETGLEVAEVTGYLGSFDYTSGSGRRTRQHTFTVSVAQPGPLTLSEHSDHAWISRVDERPVSHNVADLLTKHLATT
ncbi:8-oxo-dGTP diphosphatase [Streptoalloteichus tenebrarius]|uniref:8-oxo-dGTP diphosphatase n=1 Tax=Streptoalloteichus tenebrarius (strain ATCC 17920 / DSM 40477 / JCM 4838 / CBS 697.72 / NBRC 16177 / NCIMB 11028 / NRRL B-12390 / A12253. 1 / ISP 5477) TaxID=1933 RepID=A0ABT1HQW6_STRSD|nr:NUDIX domain-containing protein [Streptoalloteichus tenebrarius]MCP2257888.1 8-oxo-dGTP diphosphatase [Streptoalloteichus tenebrarius]BFE99749.1 hypothetical protein GCM10020241_14250 [Streptoalloteichus tenebrarius]